MTLEKLTIQYEQGNEGNFNGTITALFNPSQLSFVRSVTWEPVDPAMPSKSGRYKGMQFKIIPPETLTVHLFFDTYERTTLTGKPISVNAYVDQLRVLATVEQDLHRPPLCRLRWGKATIFMGVLTSLNRSYQLFLEDGTPVRATAECIFQDCKMVLKNPNELHSADVAKVYTIKPGDTLMGIAQSFYNDTSQWRVIADANDIDNPRTLTPGRTLSIPPIT